MLERIGFFTALGTPMAEDGRLHAASMTAQVRDQLDFGALGLLVMGSMGMGVFVRQNEYARVAQVATQAAARKGQIFVGISDTCVGRCLERAQTLRGLSIDGVVATLPYYYPASPAQQLAFYRALADGCGFPLYLYDLPLVSKGKISFDTALQLAAHDAIRGIKTGDLGLAVDLLTARDEGRLKSDFAVYYSGLDTFDSACRLGVGCNLDGMFSCTGPLARQMYESMRAGDVALGRAWLKKILSLRDVFAQSAELLALYSHAMNLLGYAGNFAVDYYGEPDSADKARVEASMRVLGLL